MFIPAISPLSSFYLHSSPVFLFFSVDRTLESHRRITSLSSFPTPLHFAHVVYPPHYQSIRNDCQNDVSSFRVFTHCSEWRVIAKTERNYDSTCRKADVLAAWMRRLIAYQSPSSDWIRLSSFPPLTRLSVLREVRGRVRRHEEVVVEISPRRRSPSYLQFPAALPHLFNQAPPRLLGLSIQPLVSSRREQQIEHLNKESKPALECMAHAARTRPCEGDNENKLLEVRPHQSPHWKTLVEWPVVVLSCTNSKDCGRWPSLHGASRHTLIFFRDFYLILREKTV